MEQLLKKIVIAGGGTAGWMAAALLSKSVGKLVEIVLVESDEIGTVGVGEATIPLLINFHRMLELDEAEFMSATNATFKTGISFENWKHKNHKYIHSFGHAGRDCWGCSFISFWLAGMDRGFAEEYENYCVELMAAKEERFGIFQNTSVNYAYHLDATKYAKLLRAYSEKLGVVRIEGKISNVNLCNASGEIKSLTMQSGSKIEGDFFIDCTGFRALLIGDALHTGYMDWSQWLLCDSAIAVQTEAVDGILPYTRSIAHDFGWQWRIPLQTRVGNGLVYCSKYISDDQAKVTLLNNIEGAELNEPRVIKFRAGTRLQHWKKNCLALGLSSGFLEPLESTSIHLIQKSLVRFIQLFPLAGIKQSDIDEFNNKTIDDIEKIRDFIILHYKVTERDDTPFWRYCKNMSVPESLMLKIQLFQDSGRVFRNGNELFGEESWTQVMMGQGIFPNSYHPVPFGMSDQELIQFLKNISQEVKYSVSQLPRHKDFIERYCRSKEL